MEYISKEELEEVREKADIVDIISRYIQVNKAGSSFKAVCPFHDDHNPSLHINPQKKVFRCYVCNTGGSVFDFVNFYEKLDSFPKAVEKVADLIGYELKTKPSSYLERKVDPHIKKLREINEEAIKYTMYELKSSSGITQKEYLAKRGITDKEIDYFKIGYNPYNNSLYEFLKGKGYTESDLVEDNVIRDGEKGVRDAFSGRITFPIHDYYGNPIGFSARSLDPNAMAKYLNTSETTLFKKSEVIYNAHNAKNSARKEGKVYVCEGVTDVIAFYRAGIENAVCTLGKNSTNKQIRLLKQMAPTIVICYDGDRAGQEGTLELARLAQESNADVHVVINDTGLDPDEILNKYGKDKLIEVLKHEVYWMDFVFTALKKKYNLSNYLEKKNFAEEALKDINRLKDANDKNHYLNELKNLTGLSFSDSTKPKDETKELTKYEPTITIKDGLYEVEESILAMMLNSEEAINVFENELGFLLEKRHKMLAIMIVDYYRRNDEINSLSFIEAIDDAELKNVAVQIVDSKGDLQYDEDRMKGYIFKVIKERYTRQIKHYKELIDLENSQEEADKLFQKMEECIREVKRFENGQNN